MVPKGNPRMCTSGRSRKTRCPSRHAQPRIRGNREQIEASLKKAGGQALADAVYKTKVADGSTISPISTSSDTIVSDARARRRRCHMAIRSDVPRAGRKPDHLCPHPSQPEHNGHICRRGGGGRATQEAAKLWLSFIHAPEGCRSSSATGSSLHRQRRQPTESPMTSQHRRQT